MSGAPLWPLALTLGAYAAAVLLWERQGRPAMLNPTLVAIALVALALLASGADRGAYRAGAQPIHLLLGPAVVALAVPLLRHGALLRARAAALAAALAVGSTATILLTLALAAWLGAGAATLVSLAPKSATTGVSMAISAQWGGIAALTAVVTILAGITGAVAGPALLDALRIQDPVARGFAIGIASHGIGTARAFQESEATGTAAGLAMGLNAVLTALLAPLLIALQARLAEP